MILIISQQSDSSTNYVIDWLFYKGQGCYRINGKTIFDFSSLTTFELDSNINNLTLKLDDDNSVDLFKIKSIWYRRDTINPPPVLSEIRNEVFYQDVLKHLRSENIEAKEAFYYCIQNDKKILGNFENATINKIKMLLLAKKNGIDVPATITTNTKSSLLVFKNKHDKIITKAVQDGFDFIKEEGDKNDLYLSYTEEITNELIESIPDTFFPSLFQEKLDKELDIRTFFLDGKCYSMAIFSQLDNQTNIDFRKYNRVVNNRNVPYRLPDLLEKNINNLMIELGLNTGSIDIIKTKQGRFVFLEVNPVGQYGMTSYPCNYHLDKKIAEYLYSV